MLRSGSLDATADPSTSYRARHDTPLGMTEWGGRAGVFLTDGQKGNQLSEADCAVSLLHHRVCVADAGGGTLSAEVVLRPVNRM